MENYKKVTTIGKGSFGYAVLVRHKKEQKNFYVMKVINIQKMKPKQQEEAMNEIKVLKSLNNPFIIKYKESFLHQNFLCIVMNYADGGDLYHLIKKKKEQKQYIPESLIKKIFTQICISLLHVHKKKILHRDLKTQNIFLTKDKNVKLGDFGISRVLQHTYDLAKTAIGTPYYLSPEICQEKPYNHKSDVWSIGCILYEMLSLNHAFDSDSMKGLIIKILQGNYPPPPSSYSDEILELLNLLLKTDPKERPGVEDILRMDFIREEVERLEKVNNEVLFCYGDSRKINGFKFNKKNEVFNNKRSYDNFVKYKEKKNISGIFNKKKNEDDNIFNKNDNDFDLRDNNKKNKNDNFEKERKSIREKKVKRSKSFLIDDNRKNLRRDKIKNSKSFSKIRNSKKKLNFLNEKSKKERLSSLLKERKDFIKSKNKKKIEEISKNEKKKKEKKSLVERLTGNMPSMKNYKSTKNEKKKMKKINFIHIKKKKKRRKKKYI